MRYNFSRKTKNIITSLVTAIQFSLFIALLISCVVGLFKAVASGYVGASFTIIFLLFFAIIWFCAYNSLDDKDKGL